MKKKYSFMVMMLFFVILFAACSNKGASTDDNNNNGEKEKENERLFEIDASLEGEITFWTFTPDIYIDIVKGFNKDYPNIKVKVVGMEGLENQLQTTLAAGTGAPDVSQVEQGSFARFSTNDLLEDLLQPPYNAGQYKEYLTDYNWERWHSVDGKRLLGMPWDVTPGIFYYREDIYEQMGLPSDPEELGEFLQSEENVLDAAQTLAANDIYMWDWRDLPAVQYGDSLGYFDSDYNWTRNTDRMAELFDLVKSGIQLGWAPQICGLCSDEGRQLMMQGKIASLAGGSFLARELANVLPEQSGQWRATRLPLDVNAGLGGSSFVIPAQGNNKELAWAFVQWMTLSEEAWKVFVEHSVQPSYTHITALPWYQELTNEYLGGQQDYKLYSSLEGNIPVKRMTPLDGSAWTIFIDSLNESINNNIDSKTILNQIETDVMKELGSEIEKLKEELSKY